MASSKMTAKCLTLQINGSSLLCLKRCSVPERVLWDRFTLENDAGAGCLKLSYSLLGMIEEGYEWLDYMPRRLLL